jgi:parallel beta-helix repeat protein
MRTCITILIGVAIGAIVFTAQRSQSQLKSQADAVIDAGKFPSLQAAFDAVPEGGGIVRIPPGDFRITQPLVLSRAETRVEGSGASTRIINANADSQPALIVRPATYEQDKKARIWRVQLADFRVNGDPKTIDAKSTEPKGGDGVVCYGVNEVYISGLSIDHHGGNGLSLIDCYEDPRICNSIFTYNRKTGVNLVACHDIVVNANQFEENQDALHCNDSFNLCMNGNNIDDHLGHGVVIENTYGSVLSGNMIEECDGTAIILDRDCYGITLSANVIAHNMGGGIDLRDAWGCSLSANTFVLDHVHSVTVGPNSGRVAISGNSFCNSYIGGQTKRPLEHKQPISQDIAHGILLNGTSDIAITGNVFSGLRDQAVTTQGECQRVAFVGNTIAAGIEAVADRSLAELKSVWGSTTEANAVAKP